MLGLAHGLRTSAFKLYSIDLIPQPLCGWPKDYHAPSPRSAMASEEKMLIAGEWCNADGGETMEVNDP